MSGSFVRASKFRHVAGKPNRKLESYTEVPALTPGEGNFIKANSKFFTVIKEGGGGPLLVHNLEKLERFKVDHPVLNVHKARVQASHACPVSMSILN